jgi:catechol 2,3-dioxygenase-like lactoylglutathione lyase family enzyme
MTAATGLQRDGAMKVNALDHVNIISADLHGTARFYGDLLGLEIRDAPPPLTHDQAQWMHDDSGRAIIHVNSLDCPRTYQRDVTPGPTGSIHHVALNCSGYPDIQARLATMGRDHKVSVVASVGLRQIFTLDPNGVLLELNFFGE